ncbi:hypothetical protein HGA34_00015 [Candidatus Falkowbacteria bacterium]|nr:hypothetical protein [Candidatus Falkowbacteria bacterium]
MKTTIIVLLSIFLSIPAISLGSAYNVCVDCHMNLQETTITATSIKVVPKKVKRSDYSGDTPRFIKARKVGYIEVVKDDSLSFLAFNLWGKSSSWKGLARANSISVDKPRFLKPGERLVFPGSKPLIKKTAQRRGPPIKTEALSRPSEQPAIAPELPAKPSAPPEKAAREVIVGGALPPAIAKADNAEAVQPVVTAAAIPPPTRLKETSLQEKQKHAAPEAKSEAEAPAKPFKAAMPAIHCIEPKDSHAGARVEAIDLKPVEAIRKCASDPAPPTIVDAGMLNHSKAPAKSEPKPLAIEDSPSKASALKVDGEIGYFWGCLDMMGKCQGFGGNLDIYPSYGGNHNFGLNIGADLTVGILDDYDSHMDRRKYSVAGGLTYKYERSGKKLVMRNGLMYQYTEDIVDSLSLDNYLPPGAEFNGFDLSKMYLHYNRAQSSVLLYSKADYTQSFDQWRVGLGYKYLLPISENVSTDSPESLARLDQRLALVRLGLQKKIGADTYFGIETNPVIYSGEKEDMLGAKASLLLNYKSMHLELGALMHPYGLPDIAKERGGTFTNTTNAFIEFKISY